MVCLDFGWFVVCVVCGLALGFVLCISYIFLGSGVFYGSGFGGFVLGFFVIWFFWVVIVLCWRGGGFF